MKKSSSCNEALRQMIAETEVESGKQMKIFRFDDAGEYLSKSYTNWFQNKGVRLEPTPLYSTESNVKAEQYNQTLNYKSKTMMMTVLGTRGCAHL